MRVYLTNMGCKLNQAEIERFSRDFQGAGHEVVGSLTECDLHVINSCTVTHVAAREARKLARRAGRLEGHGRDGRIRTVLTGCYASAEPETAAELAGVDLVVTNDVKERLVELVHQALPELAPSSPAELEVPYLPLDVAGASGHTRAMVKVGDGCNMRCSFCIIPFTRGRESSRPIPEIVREVRELAAAGYREVVVTGVQISSYRWEGKRLHDLTAALLAETDIERLRLTSIAPWDFDPRLFDLFAEHKSDGRLCRHVHMSLQSGSTETLRRMRRPYSPAAYRQVMERIREHIPGVAVTTDVIVGFPGETDTEFEESLAFVEQMRFARVHLFPYSVREGTAGAALPDQIDPNVKRARMKRMLEVASAAEREFWRAHLGEAVEVLWESQRDGRWSGLTDHYIRVFARSSLDLQGAITSVRLVELEEGGVRGEVVGDLPGPLVAQRSGDSVRLPVVAG